MGGVKGLERSPHLIPESSSGMSEVTHILTAIEQGEARAGEELLPLVYDELRRLAASQLAHEVPGQTLQATALVHEAWLRLAGAPDRKWAGERHFFGAAAQAMRPGLEGRYTDALDILRREYNPRCQPPWSEKELLHKVTDAVTKPHVLEAGWLQGARTGRSCRMLITWTVGKGRDAGAS